MRRSLRISRNVCLRYINEIMVDIAVYVCGILTRLTKKYSYTLSPEITVYLTVTLGQFLPLYKMCQKMVSFSEIVL